jgi:hypothetical protein
MSFDWNNFDKINEIYIIEYLPKEGSLEFYKEFIYNHIEEIINDRNFNKKEKYNYLLPYIRKIRELKILNYKYSEMIDIRNPKFFDLYEKLEIKKEQLVNIILNNLIFNNLIKILI